jgi:anti-sigma regulatory factor (Ser/Thr protein kinase)
MLTETITLAPDPASVPQGRRFVRRVLTAWDVPDLLDTALLLTSELLTNSVLHARTGIVLTLTRPPGRVDIVVGDLSDVLPARRRHAADATTGRGVELLDRLATSWDVVRDGAGKAVHVSLSEQADPWAAATDGQGVRER